MPRVRASSQELTPFLQFVMSHTVGSHFSSPRGLSSKIVLSFAVNCRLVCLDLHCHLHWFASYDTSVRPQVGQITPFGQSSDTI